MRRDFSEAKDTASIWGRGSLIFPSIQGLVVAVAVNEWMQKDLSELA